MADRAPRAVVSRHAGVDVGHAERDVPDAVAVLPHVLGDLTVRGEGRREHDRDVVLAHDVARAVPDLRLEAAERDRGEPPQGAEVRRRLAGVAHPELDVVDAVERQEVLGLGIGVAVDPGAGLVGGGRADVARGRGAVSRLGHAKGSGLSCCRSAGRASRAGWILASTVVPALRTVKCIDRAPRGQCAVRLRFAWFCPSPTRARFAFGRLLDTWGSV